MKDIADGIWGLFIAAILAAVGMFYRHGYVIAGLQQKATDQGDSQIKLWEKLDSIDEKLTDIQITLGRGTHGQR